MWNAETAGHLDAWYASPEGAFALRQGKRLFQRLCSAWPRRGHTLLDVGCGTGIFLEMLWEYGFDVTGFDNDPAMLEASRTRLANRADFQLGQADHLPYDDNSMDYVALLSVLGYVQNPEAVLAEAMRVAGRGVIVGFTNQWSMHYLCHGIPWPGRPHRENSRGQWMNLWSLARMARRLVRDCRITTRSVLLGPPSTWRPSLVWGRVNSATLPLPVGAYVGMSIDVQPHIPLTPLLLSTRMPTSERPMATVPLSNRSTNHQTDRVP